MADNPSLPPHNTVVADNPFSDDNDITTRNSSPNSAAPSMAGGQPARSRPAFPQAERLRGLHRVRFGSGEALDQLGGRESFDLTEGSPAAEDNVPPPIRPRPRRGTTFTSPFRDPDEDEESGVVVESPHMLSPELSPQSETSTPPLAMPPRIYSFDSPATSEALELDEKHDYFNGDHSSSGRQRTYGGSQSAPGSALPSPTLHSFAVGSSQAVGAVPVDDIPLLSTGPKGETGDEQNENRGITRVLSNLKPKLTTEVYDLVRHHTRRGAISAESTHEYSYGHVPDSGTQTPVANKQHADYVAKPQQFRGGVLSSLLALYQNNETQHGLRSGQTTPGGYQSPGNSGISTPKWYSKSANNSTASLSGLLAAPNTALMGPAVPGVRRPKGKNSRSSGIANKIKHLSRPTLEEEIKITVHIADTIARQRYILKLCKALMLYGSPTHRLEEALKMTSRVLGIDGQFLYIPGCMIISFSDPMTHTSEMHIVKVAQGVNLGKLHDCHLVYKAVVHDMLSVNDATVKIEEMMEAGPKLSAKWLIPIYGIASATVGPFGFQARLIDMPILFLLGCLLGFLQLVVAPNSELYSNIFEISAAVLCSFLARAFGSIRSGELFCFSALTQGSIALILPGYIILCGSLELQAKNMVAGSVRMFYAIVYSLFLGFGITIGSALYGLVDDQATSNVTCQNPLDWRWNFLFVPLFAMCLAIINQVHLKQLPVQLIIALAGYVVNYFSSLKFVGQPQVSNGLGAFTIGVMGNLWSRLGHGLAFAAMLPAIFVQVPSGLAAQGSLLSGIQSADALAGNSTALDYSRNNTVVLELGFSMVQVAVGITVGLFMAALVVYPFGKRRSSLFSF